MTDTLTPTIKTGGRGPLRRPEHLERLVFLEEGKVLDSFTAGPFTTLVDGPKANLDDGINSHIVSPIFNSSPAALTADYHSSRKTSSIWSSSTKGIMSLPRV